jgi:hypothetical protein
MGTLSRLHRARPCAPLRRTGPDDGQRAAVRGFSDEAFWDGTLVLRPVK